MSYPSLVSGTQSRACGFFADAVYTHRNMLAIDLCLDEPHTMDEGAGEDNQKTAGQRNGQICAVVVLPQKESRYGHEEHSGGAEAEQNHRCRLSRGC